MYSEVTPYTMYSALRSINDLMSNKYVHNKRKVPEDSSGHVDTTNKRIYKCREACEQS